VENLDDHGHLLRRGSGFFIKDGTFVTFFRTIEGAHGLRLVLASGKEISTSSVAAWNRRQDWAVLSVAAKCMPSLQLAGAKTWTIGDHCSCDRGEVIGVLGGALPDSLLHGYQYQSLGDTSELAYGLTGGTAASSTLLPQALSVLPVTLQDLCSDGQMMVPVTNSKFVLFGMLSQGEQIKGKHQ
jgi:hypothetical protein